LPTDALFHPEAGGSPHFSCAYTQQAKPGAQKKAPNLSVPGVKEACSA
jgi:hypothetical protein